MSVHNIAFFVSHIIQGILYHKQITILYKSSKIKCLLLEKVDVSPRQIDTLT